MTRTMPPQRLSDQEYRLRTAYRANGFTVAASGRVLARSLPLQPAAKPPGLSRQPEPRRPNVPSPPLPDMVERLSEVSVRVQRLYEMRNDGAYHLGHVGKQLAAYRRMVIETYPADPPPPRKIVKFDRDGWARLLATAESSERGYFLRAAAAKMIKIES